MKNNEEIDKIFYRISEVVKLLGVPASMLRFWEKEFTCLKQIKKNKKGDRLYTNLDIENLKLIHHLVKEKGYTLTGANEYLELHKDTSKKNVSSIESLKKVRQFLEELKNSF